MCERYEHLNPIVSESETLWSETSGRREHVVALRDSQRPLNETTGLVTADLVRSRCCNVNANRCRNRTIVNAHELNRLDTGW